MSQAADALVAVIVVTWNRRDDLRRCLVGLADQTLREHLVVVVDNASTDGTAEMVEREFSSSRLIRNPANLGFAAANNVGIRATRTPYVATLNNDAIAEPGWLEALVRRADANPDLGSVASKMVFAHDPNTVNSCGIALDRAAIAWDLFGGRPTAAVDAEREVFGPCAGAALYRRAMLDDIGLFDEDFFAYLEDVDLAWRARLRGWRCALAPDALVRHAHSGTLGEGSPFKRYLLARNKVWVVAKCAPADELRRSLPIIVTYDVGAATFGAVRQRDWVSIRGRLAGLRGLPAALRKRAAIQAGRTSTAEEVRRTTSPLAAPWDVPRRYRHLVGSRESGAGGGELRLGRLSPWERRPQSGAKADEPGEGAPRARIMPGPEAGHLVRRGTGPQAVVAHMIRPEAGHLVRRGLLRAAGLVLPSPGGATRFENILVIRPDHLGDVLLSCPAIQLLRDTLPDPRVTVLAGPWGAASLQGLDVRVATFPFPGFTRHRGNGPLAPYRALLALAARLRKERFDAALVLRPDHWWGALAAALAGIPFRVGYVTPETSPFLTHPVTRREGEHASASARRLAKELLRVAGVPTAPIAEPATFRPSPAALARAREWLVACAAGGRPVVAIHPGSGASVKNWPARRWVQVVEALKGDVRLVLTGGANDRPLLAEIQAALPIRMPQALDFTWDELAGLYCQVDLVLGMDSGPLHLAAAVGTPTVRVYGPTDARVYGPDPSRARQVVVQAALPCVPCGDLVAPPCGYLSSPPCLAAASAEEIVQAARAGLTMAAPA